LEDDVLRAEPRIDGFDIGRERRYLGPERILRLLDGEGVVLLSKAASASIQSADETLTAPEERALVSHDALD
jgi:hypothetical protein